MKTSDQYVSILGSEFFQPISDLLDKLFSRPLPVKNGVQAHPIDNSYAVSICILSVVCLESFVIRARYLHKCPERSALEFFKKCFPNYPGVEELEELFVIRDILVHNHPWEIEYSWDSEGNLQFHTAKQNVSAGDKKYRKAANPTTRTTNKLKLNVVPTKVDRHDVKTALSEIWKVLLFLENTDRSLCYVSHLPIMYQGHLKTFGEVIQAL